MPDGETSCNGVQLAKTVWQAILCWSLWVFARRAADDIMFGEEPNLMHRADWIAADTKTGMLFWVNTIKQIRSEIERMKKSHE